MNYNTLALYLIAGGASTCLCVLLWAIARYKSDTLLFKSSIGTIFLQSVAFTLSGFGPDLPRWMTVMGTNMAFLAAGVLIYAGFTNYHDHHAHPTPNRHRGLDWFGWGTVAGTALPFWYWGLVEPNGYARSAVFSFAAAIICGRSTHLLLRQAWQQQRNALLWTLAVLVCILTLWMLTRGVMFVWMESPLATIKGNNPTSWVMVFWYIVVITLIITCVIWLEFTDLHRPLAKPRTAQPTRKRFSFLEIFRKKLLVMWATVMIAVIGIGSEAALFFAQTLDWEKEHQVQTITAATDLNANHTVQVFNQVDTVLHAVRSYFQLSGSLTETESFINALPFDKTVIDNIYLISPQGKLLIVHDPAMLGMDLADRAYLWYHHATPTDLLYISAVEVGRVTHKQHFQVTRRINHADGSMAGIVLVTVNPQALSDYYTQQLSGTQNVAALLGTTDQKPRAAAPSPTAQVWAQPVHSPIWQALLKAPTGRYRNTVEVDGIDREFVYKKLDSLPLVVVSGFSAADLTAAVYRRVRWPVLGVLVVLAGLLLLASLLTIEIKRRQEQDNFMAMLSHELKTPLSVLRLSLGAASALSECTKAHALQAIQDMDTIIHRCLQADQLQHQNTPVLKQRCQLHELLADLHTANHNTERLHITATDLPTLHTDPQLLHIALNNLVDNALKYAPPDAPINLTAQHYTHQRKPGVLVSISNPEGSAGMPDALSVFKKYYRSPRAHSKTGSGLGLYLVHTVARLLGGWVRYVPSDGVVNFELWLPESP